MSQAFNSTEYFKASPTVAGIPNNASFVGPWLKCANIEDFAWSIFVAAANGNPAGTWLVEVSNDQDPARPVQGPIPLAATAELTAAAPAGAGAAVKQIIPYFTLYGGCPRAQWIRLSYVFTSGGNANPSTIFVGYSRRGTL